MGGGGDGDGGDFWSEPLELLVENEKFIIYGLQELFTMSGSWFRTFAAFMRRITILRMSRNGSPGIVCSDNRSC